MKGITPFQLHHLLWSSKLWNHVFLRSKIKKDSSTPQSSYGARIIRWTTPLWSEVSLNNTAGLLMRSIVCLVSYTEINWGRPWSHFCLTESVCNTSKGRCWNGMIGLDFSSRTFGSESLTAFMFQFVLWGAHHNHKSLGSHYQNFL